MDLTKICLSKCLPSCPLIGSLIGVHIDNLLDYVHATVIPLRTHPIPSELGSETWLGPTSTGLRDHLGTPGAVVSCHILAWLMCFLSFGVLLFDFL